MADYIDVYKIETDTSAIQKAAVELERTQRAAAELGGEAYQLAQATAVADRALKEVTVSVVSEADKVAQLEAKLRSLEAAYFRGTASVAQYEQHHARLTGELQRLQLNTTLASTQTVQLSTATSGLAGVTPRTGLAINALAQGMEDLQYGVGGAMNNLSQVAMLLGAGGLVVAGVTITGVAINQLARHWSDLTALFGERHTETEAGRMERLEHSTKRTAEETKELNKHKKVQAELEALLQSQGAPQRMEAGGVKAAVDRVGGPTAIAAVVAGLKEFEARQPATPTAANAPPEVVAAFEAGRGGRAQQLLLAAQRGDPAALANLMALAQTTRGAGATAFGQALTGGTNLMGGPQAVAPVVKPETFAETEARYQERQKDIIARIDKFTTDEGLNKFVRNIDMLNAAIGGKKFSEDMAVLEAARKKEIELHHAANDQLTDLLSKEGARNAALTDVAGAELLNKQRGEQVARFAAMAQQTYGPALGAAMQRAAAKGEAVDVVNERLRDQLMKQLPAGLSDVARHEVTAQVVRAVREQNAAMQDRLALPANRQIAPDLGAQAAALYGNRVRAELLQNQAARNQGGGVNDEAAARILTDRLTAQLGGGLRAQTAAREVVAETMKKVSDDLLGLVGQGLTREAATQKMIHDLISSVAQVQGQVMALQNGQNMLQQRVGGVRQRARTAQLWGR